MRSHRVYIGVGSNIDSERSIRAALRLLRARMTVLAISTVYLNAAEGRPEQPPFHNLVLMVETELPAAELKQLLLQIERMLGRVRGADKFAPRTIDLDILIYGMSGTTAEGELTPDPAIPHKPFLAVPLAELSPDLVLPADGRPLAEVAAALGPHGMTPLPGLTDTLRDCISAAETDT